MNYNILAYCIFLISTVFVILYVGHLFYTNGRIFIHQLFQHNSQLADTTNKILLLAYYLFNIGYAFLQLKGWGIIAKHAQLISSLSMGIGRLILILAITHYFNMLSIYLISKKINR